MNIKTINAALYALAIFGLGMLQASLVMILDPRFLGVAFAYDCCFFMIMLIIFRGNFE